MTVSTASSQPSFIDDARFYGEENLPPESDAGDTAAFLVVGQDAGQDVLFWSAVYRMVGRGTDRWLVGKGGALAAVTVFIAVPSDTASSTGIQDHEFVSSGMYLSEYYPLDSLRANRSSAEASWDVAGRTYAWRPDGWQVRGQHGELDVNLDIVPTQAPRWKFGEWKDVKTAQSGGHETNTRVRGWIATPEHRFEFEDAFGNSHRVVGGDARDVVEELRGGRDVTIVFTAGDDLDLYVSKHGGVKSGHRVLEGDFRVGDHTARFEPTRGEGNIALNVLDRWHDPRSDLSIPSRWHLGMIKDGAAADLTITATGRSYFQYTMRSGRMIMYWILAVANGEVMVDGRRARVENKLVAIRWGRGLMWATEHGDDGRM